MIKIFFFLLFQDIEAVFLYMLKDSLKTATPTTPTTISMIEKLQLILKKLFRDPLGRGRT